MIFPVKPSKYQETTTAWFGSLFPRGRGADSDREVGRKLRKKAIELLKLHRERLNPATNKDHGDHLQCPEEPNTNQSFLRTPCNGCELVRHGTVTQLDVCGLQLIGRGGLRTQSARGPALTGCNATEGL